MRKPINTGIYSWEPIPLLTQAGKIGLFSRKGAQQIANRWAKNSALPNAIGFISDCGEYWRITIAGQKE